MSGAKPGDYCRICEGGRVKHVEPCRDGHPTGTITDLSGRIESRPLSDSLPGWEKEPPIKGGHKDVWRCLGPNCGALVRLSDTSTSREAHDATFHTEDK
jgi:hypothetical protein